MALLNLSNRERGCSPRCFDLTESDYTVCVICGDKANIDTIGSRMFVLLIRGHFISIKLGCLGL